MSDTELKTLTSRINDINISHDKKEKYEDFTWEPIGSEWEDLLLSNAFVTKDCIGDGNCQFRSIETALTNAGYKTNHERLRKVIGKYIRSTQDHEFYEILQSYKLEKLHGDFKGDWDPFAVKSRRAFIKNLTTPGTHFEGDFITLSLLSKAIDIDFIILDESSYNMIDLSNSNNKREKLIILQYINFDSNEEDVNNKTNSGHYNCVGYRMPSGRIISIFKRSKLPEALTLIFDKKKFMTQHIKKIYKENNVHLTFSELVNKLQDKLRKTFSEKDKQKIASILKAWLSSRQ